MDIASEFAGAVLLENDGFSRRELQHICGKKNELISRCTSYHNVNALTRFSVCKGQLQITNFLSIKILLQLSGNDNLFRHSPCRVSKLEVDSSDIGDGDSERLFAK